MKWWYFKLLIPTGNTPSGSEVEFFDGNMILFITDSNCTWKDKKLLFLVRVVRDTVYMYVECSCVRVCARETAGESRKLYACIHAREGIRTSISVWVPVWIYVTYVWLYNLACMNGSIGDKWIKRIVIIAYFISGKRERERERGRIIPECSITGLQSYETELHFHSYVNPMPTTQWQQQQPAYTVHLSRLHVSYVHSRASDLITGRRSRTRRVWMWRTARVPWCMTDVWY